MRPALRLVLPLLLWIGCCAASAAPPVEADWALWSRLLETRPAEAQRTLAALDLRDWPEADQLRAGLLQARTLLELGRAADAAQRLQGLAAAVRRSGQPLLVGSWEVLTASTMRGAEDEAARQAHLARGLPLLRDAGDMRMLSFAHAMRVNDLLDRRDYRTAAAELEQHGRVARDSGSTHLQGVHLYWRGVLKRDLMDYDGAEKALREAAQRFRAADNPTWEADCERMLAEAFIESDRPKEALAPAQRAVELLQTLDDPVYLALSRSALSIAQAAAGQPEQALPLSAAAVQALAQRGDSPYLAQAQLRRAQVQLLAGDARSAEVTLKGEVHPLLPPLDDQPMLHRRYQQALAEVSTALGRHEQAATALRKVAALDRSGFERILRGQLDAQRGALDAQRLQRENDLLQARAQAAEQALQADTRSRRLALGGSAVLVAGAAGALWWMRRVNRRIANVAATDALTGLLNRRSVLQLGDAAFAGARTGGEPLAVLLFDLDHFKQVNDTLGHATGDRVLTHVAQALRQGLRRTDHLARYGGEEFLLLLPGTRLPEALALAERQRAAVAASTIGLPDATALPGGRLTVSVGVAMVDPADADLQAAITRADEALYRAKADGRDRVSEAAPAGPAPRDDAVAAV